MSVLLVCPCGKHWTSEDGLGASPAVCPVCGRLLAPVLSSGWRSLWSRLILVAVVTFLVVIVLGVVLVRLLPMPQRETSAVAETAITLQPEAEGKKPFDDGEPASATGLDGHPAANAAGSPSEAMRLPLLDNPPSLAPSLEAPTRPVPAKPSTAKLRELPQKNVAKLQATDEFFQQVVISRVSRYRILEMDMGQNVQYALVSRFRTKKQNDDGGMVVEQKVESVRLSHADPAMQDRLNELLQKTKGATFTLTLNARREVTKFEGGQEAIKISTGDNPLGGPSFLLWSFLDRDGWKELAQLSFFQPPPPSSPPNLGEKKKGRGQRWDRPMTHSWGPLGRWDGKIHFQSTGKQDGLDRFDYLLDLTYKPPGKGGELPFEIGKSQFQIETARGVIAYQPSRKRVAAAEERFHVRGFLTVSFFGAESAVQMDEMQLFQLRILDKNPLGP